MAIKNSIKIEKLNLEGLLKFIEGHNVSIPEFQRGYVWEDKKIKNLFDSVVKKYPIGSFIIWKTRQKIGQRVLFGKQPNKGKEKYLVLDGQQRMLTLYYLCNQNKFLDVKNFFQEIYESKGRDLIEFEHFYFDKKIHPELKYSIEKVQKFDFEEFKKKVGKKYLFPIVIVSIDKYDKAIEIFERINQAGAKIATESIFLSEAWNKKTNLGQILRRWRNKNKLSGNLDSIIFIHVLAMITQLEKIAGFESRSLDIRLATLKKIAEKIKEARSKVFEKEFRKILNAVSMATSFFAKEYGIRKIIELPSQTLVTMLGIFYYYCSDPTKKQVKELKKWFWRSALSGRYVGSGYNDNISNDAECMKRLAKAGARLNIEKADLSFEDFKDSDIKTGRSSLGNAIKLMLWKHKPQWINGEKINRWEIESEKKKKEDDHFYPYDLFRKKVIGNEINSILNLSFLSKGENLIKTNDLPFLWLERRKKEVGSKKREEKLFFISNLLPFGSIRDLRNSESTLLTKSEKIKPNIFRKYYRKFLKRRFELFKKELNRLQSGK